MIISYGMYLTIRINTLYFNLAIYKKHNILEFKHTNLLISLHIFSHIYIFFFKELLSHMITHI